MGEPSIDQGGVSDLSGANLFWEGTSAAAKTPDTVQATPVALWKCGRCGANLLTSERRGAKIMGTQVRCTNCDVINELQEIAWRGAK